MKMSNNKMEGQNSSQYNSYSLLYITCQSIGILLKLCIFYWIEKFKGGFSISDVKLIFNWHPLLMTIAFIYLFGNAILNYRSNNTKKTLKNYHVIIQCCILILVFTAGYATIISHVDANPSIPNNNLIHSWIGIITIVLFILQFLCGLLFYFYPVIYVQYGKAVAPYFVFIGIFTFILAIVTTVLGFNEKYIFALDKEYKNFSAERVFGIFLSVLCIVFGVIVIYMIIKQEFKRYPQIEYEPLP